MSAGKGYLKAILRLAEEAEDETESVCLYTLAARKGSPDAAAKLKDMGLPVPEADLCRMRRKSS